MATPEPRGTSKSPHPDRLEHGTRHQPGDLITLIAGILAILTAASLIVGLSSYYVSYNTIYSDRSYLTGYVISMAVLTFIAGGCTLLPWTRQSIGPGILLGSVAASTWGLVFFAGEPRRNNIDYLGMGYWLELVGHLILVIAACLAMLALIRDPTTRFTPQWPVDTRARAVIIFGVASAVALFFHFIVLHNHDRFSFDTKWAFLVPAVMAFAMPVCAVIATPRRFGISLLAGWTGGGAAIFLISYLNNSWYYVTRTPAIIFGCTLLLLAIAAGTFYRTKVPV